MIINELIEHASAMIQERRLRMYGQGWDIPLSCLKTMPAASHIPFEMNWDIVVELWALPAI